jgi:hypothetical protein
MWLRRPAPLISAIHSTAGRFTEDILRGSIDDCRLLIIDRVIGCSGRGSVTSTINNQKSSIINRQSKGLQDKPAFRSAR